MRRLLAFAALVLGLASCQQDFDAPVQVGGEVDFQLAVAAPEIAGTRAGDKDVDQKALNSAYGAIDYLQGGTANDGLRTDWSDVNLRYSLEVYDVDDKGNVTSVDEEGNPVSVKDRLVYVVDEYQPVTFNLRLVPNRNYRFVVFADFVDKAVEPTTEQEVAVINDEKELGLHHSIGTTLGNITVKNDDINDECTDAYFATNVISIVNSAAQDMELKRPYGKVRVIATDLAELNLNDEPRRVEVTYDAKHPVAFNAITGEIEAQTSTETITFNSPYNEIYKNVADGGLQNHFYTEGYDNYKPYGIKTANNVERHTHMTLFTDYILAEKEGQTPYHFTMTVESANGKEIKTTQFNTDIPVERNKLTTVIGNVLTTATEINITIDDNFSQPNINRGVVFVSSLKELQEAIDNAKAGENNVINFEADIKGNVKITEIPETTITINGQGHKYDGCMEIIGKSEYKNATTIFENIYFETNDETALVGSSFIYCNDQNGGNRYPDNVTIKNCKFKGTDNTVGASFRALNGNVIVDGCQMFAGHSLMQLKSCSKAKVDVYNTTITAGRGIALGDANVVTIRNTEINAVSYGVRADGCTANTTIEASTINANIPVVVRKLTTGEYTLNFVASNTLTAGNEGANTEAYQVVFTNGDDEATFVEPTGTFVANGAENFKVFPEPVVDKSTILIYDAEDLLEWAWLVNNADGVYNAMFMDNVTLPQYKIADDGTKYYFTNEAITIDNNIPSGSNWTTVGTYSPKIKKYTEGVIDGNGKTLTGLTMHSTHIISGFIGYCENVIIKDLTFDQATLYSTQQYCSPISYVDDGSYIYNVHTTNSTIIGTDYVAGLTSMFMDHFDTKGLCERIEADPTIKRYMPMTTMENCTVDANTVVKGSGTFVGGICGKAYGVLIYNCHNQADVTGNKCVGGIAGYLRDYQQNEHGLIVNCSSTNSTIVGSSNYGAICGEFEHDPNHTGALTAVVGCYTNSTVNNGKIVDKFNRGTERVFGNYAAGTTADIDVLNSELEEYNAFIEQYNIDFYSKYFEQCVYSTYKIPTSKLWTAGDLQ